LTAAGDVLGTFALYYRTPRLPNDRERRLMTIWTNVAALAIRRKQSEDALRAEQQYILHQFKAQEYERKLTAYELHDGIAQYAAAAIMHLESYRRLLTHESQAAELELVDNLLRKTLEECRRMINELRPPILDEYGPAAAIEHLVQEQSSDEPRCKFEHPAAFERLSPVLEVAIFRIAQEALTNAKKHSGSPQVEIALDRQGDHVLLNVRDWGTGFSATSDSGRGLGLRGMRERVHLLGGTLRIDSKAGEGTCVSVDLPILPLPAEPAEPGQSPR
jgi:two-component system sensor histidine kinase DegS